MNPLSTNHTRYLTNPEITFERCFPLLKNFYEPKEKKLEFSDKVVDLVNSIKNNVSLYYFQNQPKHKSTLNNSKEKIKYYTTFKKMNTNNMFLKKLKLNPVISNSLEQNQNLHFTKKIIRNSSKLLRQNYSNTNQKNFNIEEREINATSVEKFPTSFKNYNQQNTTQKEIKSIKNYLNKFNLNKDVSDKLTLPTIGDKRKNNKKIILKRSINNIQEVTEDLQKNLEQRDQYLEFKKKYNRLVLKSKKNELNIDQYLGHPKNKLPFQLKNAKDPNKKKIVAVKKIIKTICRKVRIKNNGKLKMKEIIEEMKNFQNREDLFRTRIEKGHEKFFYLIDDSRMIQSRIKNKNVRLNASQ